MMSALLDGIRCRDARSDMKYWRNFRGILFRTSRSWSLLIPRTSMKCDLIKFSYLLENRSSLSGLEGATMMSVIEGGEDCSLRL